MRDRERRRHVHRVLRLRQPDWPLVRRGQSEATTGCTAPGQPSRPHPSPRADTSRCSAPPRAVHGSPGGWTSATQPPPPQSQPCSTNPSVPEAPITLVLMLAPAFLTGWWFRRHGRSVPQPQPRSGRADSSAEHRPTFGAVRGGVARRTVGAAPTVDRRHRQPIAARPRRMDPSTRDRRRAARHQR